MSRIYLKAPPGNLSRKKKGKRRVLSLFLLVTGIYLLFSAAYPILHYQYTYSTRFSPILDPRSVRAYNSKVLSSSKAGPSETDRDFSQISSWFEDGQKTVDNTFSDSKVSRYSIAIPSIKIQKAIVRTDIQDLRNNLVQYPETAPPGQLGNTVVFGHSVLPQFFNPRNYFTIFSTLYTLNVADPIYVTYDGVTYTYRIEEIFEVSPSDLSVLEQRYDQRILTLITCTPPGTYLKRLIVRAKIVD